MADPTIPLYPPQGIQAEVDLLYLANPAAIEGKQNKLTAENFKGADGVEVKFEDDGSITISGGYSLPIASREVLGGIRESDDITVSQINGVATISDMFKENVKQQVKDLKDEKDANVADINQRISELSTSTDTNISELRTETNERIDGLEKTTNEKIDNLEQNTNDKITQLDNKQTAAIEALDQKTTKNISDLQSETTQSISDLRTETTESIQSLDDKTTKAIEQLDQKTTSSIEQLDQEKTNDINQLRQDTDKNISDLVKKYVVINAGKDGDVSYMQNEDDGGIMKLILADQSFSKTTLFKEDGIPKWQSVWSDGGDNAVKIQGDNKGIYYAKHKGAVKASEEIITKAELDALDKKTTDSDTAIKGQISTLDAKVDSAVETLEQADEELRQTDTSLRTDLTAVTKRTTTIEGKIPTQASATNQLADKAFVNSTIQTDSANFRGAWNTYADIPTDVDLYPADYAGGKTPTVNDYLTVLKDEQHNDESWRYVYTGTWATNGKDGWKAVYKINDTPFTAAQNAAINSNITQELTDQITTNQNDIADLQSVKADKTAVYTKEEVNAKEKALQQQIESVSGSDATKATKTYVDETFETKTDAEESHSQLSDSISTAKSELQTKITANTTDITALKTDKADQTYVNDTFETKADAESEHQDLQNQINQNAGEIAEIDADTYKKNQLYTKDEIDEKETALQTSISDNTSKIEAERTYADATFETKAEATEAHEALEGSLASQKTELEKKITANTTDITALKSDKADKTYVDDTFETKEDASTAISEIDTKVDNAVQTVAEMEPKVEEAAAAVASKADTTYVDATFETKEDATAQYATFETKTDASTALATKANLTGGNTFTGAQKFNDYITVKDPPTSDNTSTGVSALWVNMALAQMFANKFKVVSELPSAPDPDTFYFIPEA